MEIDIGRFQLDCLAFFLLFILFHNLCTASSADVCQSYSCCIDCICCGPGTQWNGERCVSDSNHAEIACDVQNFVKIHGCVDQPICVGADCCGVGTKSVVDPSRPPEACYCIHDQETDTDEPTSSPSSFPTHPPTIEPCAITADVSCVDVTTGEECDFTTPRIDSYDETCSQDVVYSVKVCSKSQGVTYVKDIDLMISDSGSQVEKASVEIGWPDFLCCGLFCQAYEYSSAVNVCTSTHYDVSVSVIGSRWDGENDSGMCTAMDTMQVPVVGRPDTEEPTTSPSSAPTSSPSTSPSRESCVISVDLSCVDLTTGTSCDFTAPSWHEKYCSNDVVYSVEICSSSQGVTFLNSITWMISDAGLLMENASVKMGGDDFLCCGRFCQVYEHATVVNICTETLYDVSVSVDGRRWDGEHYGGSCTEMDTIQLSVAGRPSEKPSTAPTSSPTAVPSSAVAPVNPQRP